MAVLNNGNKFARIKFKLVTTAAQNNVELAAVICSIDDLEKG
jgi:hypothetical protein